ncbi:MAG: B-box zinc finger protein [Promethearchaeota archaeon]
MGLSLTGWINGVSAIGIVIFSCVLGIFFLYESRKTNAKLLFYLGMTLFFYGLMFVAPAFLDFFTILLTGKNMDFNSMLFANSISWMWLTPITIISMYIGAELLFPKKKLYVLIPYLILSSLFIVFIFLEPEASFHFDYPDTPGENTVDETLVFESPAGIIGFICILSILIFNGFGLLYRSIQSIGIIRKKFLFVSLGYILITLCAILEGLFIIGIFVVLLFRIIPIFATWLIYFGLREEPAEPKKLVHKKEVKIEEGLFRLTNRPDQITEEELTYYKQQEVCLVCKSRVGGYNIFICEKCRALYCEKCARALEDIENACWVCDTPFDESKPSRPFKKAEEDIDLEISKNTE